ncbi:hypothetical protein BRCON_2232 [Candidatus Sumerlaea chitinivorans]|uniref:Uncharacterized protein n=1 Tax=Sumerlaea chitinivorans TaxID=2250252 RepID=A0A2Z4Y7Z1_SUMC1|nr:hypothetical protein BRCON_2232 [Candidatus Sumerlaea chitinivorans]
MPEDPSARKVQVEGSKISRVPWWGDFSEENVSGKRNGM